MFEIAGDFLRGRHEKLWDDYSQGKEEKVDDHEPNWVELYSLYFEIGYPENGKGGKEGEHADDGDPQDQAFFPNALEVLVKHRRGMGGKKDSSVGRNDPCPCGSGKKYKKCHGK